MRTTNLKRDLTESLSEAMEELGQAYSVAAVLNLAHKLAADVTDASLEFTVGGFGADSHRGAHIIESISERARSLTAAIEEIAKDGV